MEQAGTDAVTNGKQCSQALPNWLDRGRGLGEVGEEECVLNI